MTEASPTSSKVERIVANSDCSSPSGTLEVAATSESMLGVDFFTPLAGHARAERVKQMSNKHVSCLLRFVAS